MLDHPTIVESVAPLLLVAVPVMLTSVVAPWLMAKSLAKAKAAEKAQDAAIRSAERKEDWARLDAVAAVQKEDAKVLYEHQEEVARQAAIAAQKLLEENKKVATVAATSSKNLLDAQARLAEQAILTNTTLIVQGKVTTNKLDVIHTLVNSNMTAAMQAELDATNRELAMMLEVIDLKKAAGKEPTIEAIDALAVTRAKISELDAALKDRVKQQKNVESLQEKKMLGDLSKEAGG